MKKKPSSRLSLKTESIRHLTPENLAAAQGGAVAGGACCSTAISQKETCSTQDSGCCRQY